RRRCPRGPGSGRGRWTARDRCRGSHPPARTAPTPDPAATEQVRRLVEAVPQPRRAGRRRGATAIPAASRGRPRVASARFGGGRGGAVAGRLRAQIVAWFLVEHGVFGDLEPDQVCKVRRRVGRVASMTALPGVGFHTFAAPWPSCRARSRTGAGRDSDVSPG